MLHSVSKSSQTLHYYVPDAFANFLIAVAEDVGGIVRQLNQSVFILLHVNFLFFVYNEIVGLIQ